MQGVKISVVITCVLAVVLTAPIYLLREPLIGLFLKTSDPAEYAAAIEAGSLWMLALCSWMPMNFLIILRAAAQGMGATRLPILAGIAEMVIRLVVAFFAVHYCSDLICWSHSFSWVGIVLVSIIGYWMLIRKMPDQKPEEK